MAGHGVEAQGNFLGLKVSTATLGLPAAEVAVELGNLRYFLWRDS